jgi:hypothetical protein
MKRSINKAALCGLTIISLVCYGAHNGCKSNQKKCTSNPGTPRSTNGAGYSSGNSPSDKLYSPKKKDAAEKKNQSASSCVQSSPRAVSSGSLSSLEGAPPLKGVEHNEKEKIAAEKIKKEQLSNATHHARMFFNKLEPMQQVTDETIKNAQEYVKAKTGIVTSSKSLWLHAAQWKKNHHAFKSQQHNTTVDDLMKAAKEYEERAQKSHPDGVDVPSEQTYH